MWLGRTSAVLCPVAALLAFLAIRGNTDGPLFMLEDGSVFTKVDFVSRLRSSLSQIGLESSEYAGHSFRIGAATTAAECGMEDSTIKMLGRWASDAFQVYVKTPRVKLAALSVRLAQGMTR